MNSSYSNHLLRKLISITGAISVSLLLSLPALALLQSETTSEPIASDGEQLLSQSDGGDSGDDSGDGSDSGNDSGDDSDVGDNAGDDGSGDDSGDDSGDNDSDSSDSDDSGADSAGSPGGGDGDSGEAFRTRSEPSEGGAPYIGVGESMRDDESSVSQ